MRESTIEQYFVKCAVFRGWETRKVQWIGMRGAPDRLLMVPAVRRGGDTGNMHILPRAAAIVWVELKATGIAPDSYQLREHERMKAAGQDVRVIDSIEDVDALFRELS